MVICFQLKFTMNLFSNCRFLIWIHSSLISWTHTKKDKWGELWRILVRLQRTNSSLKVVPDRKTAFSGVKGVARGGPEVPVIPLLQAFFNLEQVAKMAWRFSLKMSKQTSIPSLRLWELMKKGHELILISCDLFHQIEKNGGYSRLPQFRWEEM